MTGARVRSRRGPGGEGTVGVVGVVGARGGAGASVTAALLARALARRAPAVLVDTGWGPSAATVLGLDEQPGLRWPDLTGARGAVDPDQLTTRLLRWGRCAVLPTDDARPGPPPAEVLPHVLEALTDAFGAVVLDLDRAAVLGGGPAGAPDLAAACRSLVLVTPRDVPGVVGARLVRDRLDAHRARVGLAVRGPAPGGLAPAQVAEAVGLPLLGRLPWSRGLCAAVDCGAGPVPSTALAREVARLARTLA